MTTACIYIVVTGLPGGGKSTVGAALAAARHVPLLDKDLISKSFSTRWAWVMPLTLSAAPPTHDCSSGPSSRAER